MAYIDKAYLLKVVKQADYTNLTGGDDTAFDTAVAGAQSMVDGYLQSRVKTLPLTDPPESIKNDTANITLFNLHRRIQPNQIPEWVKDLYDASIDHLKDISKGLVMIKFNDPEPEQESTVEVTGNQAVMRRDDF